MGKFDLYKIDLKGMSSDSQEVDYLLDNRFFTNIGGEDIQKGKINVSVKITKLKDSFNFAFNLKGIVIIPCDRCLDDMDHAVETTARLIVKLGKDFSEESDEIVIIPETEGIINLAWFLYEFVVLTLPIKRVHLSGKCNKQMTSKLKKHSTKTEENDSFDTTEDDMIVDDEVEESTDPRWDALKEFKEEE